ncbi:MAG: peroxiredoxin [Myxococcales bacterium]
MSTSFPLPEGLPVPVDDGACAHLPGARMPHLALPSTAGGSVDLAGLAGLVIVYCYPMTGRPDRPLPTGWDAIPGARGCTPQSCGFRDHHQELRQLGAQVFGVSAQSTEYQQEAAARLHLPFALLSDASLELAAALRLPTFEVEGMRLIRRLALIVRDGTIAKCFYPIFPPDRNAGDVLAWLRGASPAAGL